MSGAQILTAGSLTASFHRNDGEEWVRATIKHGGRRVWIGLSASLAGNVTVPNSFDMAAEMSTLLLVGTEIKAGQTVSVTTSVTVVPAQREPVAPWVRLETPGTYLGHPWRCNVLDEHARRRVPARYSRGWGGPVGRNGACEDCAEAAGVFGPVAAYQSASSSGYAAGGISIGSGSGTPWSPSIGAPIVSGSIGTGTKIVLPSLGMPKPAFLDMPPVVTKPSTAPVTKPAWRCAYAGHSCKTPDAPASRTSSLLSRVMCVVCQERIISELMHVHGRAKSHLMPIINGHVPAIHPSYLPDPSVYASPFRRAWAHERTAPVVRVDLDDIP